MTETTIEIRDTAVIEAIDELIRRGRDTQPAMESIGQRLVARIRLAFRAGTDPYGEPWEPVIRGGQPLRRRGFLAQSFTARAERDRVILGSNRTVSWRGAVHSLAAIHHFGAVVRAKWAPALVFRIGQRVVRVQEVTIPARPLVPDPARGLPDTWRRDALTVLSEHLSGDTT